MDTRVVTCGLLLASWLCPHTLAQESRTSAQGSKFQETRSRSEYAHWIELYDANELKIDPADPNAPPYSPVTTCGKCHDYQAIAHGYHFHALENGAPAGRKGEPWIWTDRRTGTQIPLSYRGWPGTYDPRSLGITPRQFLLQFGRHLPGGIPGVKPAPPAGSAEAPASPETAAAADAAAAPETAHTPETAAVPEAAASPAAKEAPRPRETRHRVPRTPSGGNSPANWPSTACSATRVTVLTAPRYGRCRSPTRILPGRPSAAIGLAKIEGAVKSLPEDYDPTQAPADANTPSRLPRTQYNQARFNADQKVFFDIRRKPRNDACYYCHSVQPVGEGVLPVWSRDEDVHVKAGMLCADCHRNGLDHHTVRGFEKEEHPSGLSVESLSCRGCHIDEAADAGPPLAGRLGAPRPVHSGLPALHFDKMSCTSCHSGPFPQAQIGHVQTAMAHGLGLPSHLYNDQDPPVIASPVPLPHDGMIYPHHVVWPAFWGMIQDDKVTPLHPEQAYSQLRRVLRVRRDFTEELSTVRLNAKDKVQALGEERAKVPDFELTEEEKTKLAELEKSMAADAFREKLAAGLAALAKGAPKGARPIYVSGGRAYLLGEGDKLEMVSHPAAQPYAWALAHDVRPGRWSMGVSGCYECHADGAPLFESVLTAAGPAPDAQPVAQPVYQLQGLDKTKLDVWNLSFQGRPIFKWFGFVSMGIVGLILLLYALVGINGLLRIMRGRRAA